MDSNTWEGSWCRTMTISWIKWAKKRSAIHPLAKPKTRSFWTSRNLSFDRSTREDKPLYLTSFYWEKIVPKPRQKTLSAPSQRLENSISHFDLRPTCPAATAGCCGPPLCIRPIWSCLSVRERRWSCVCSARQRRQLTVVTFVVSKSWCVASEALTRPRWSLQEMQRDIIISDLKTCY